MRTLPVTCDAQGRGAVTFVRSHRCSSSLALHSFFCLRGACSEHVHRILKELSKPRAHCATLSNGCISTLVWLKLSGRSRAKAAWTSNDKGVHPGCKFVAVQLLRDRSLSTGGNHVGFYMHKLKTSEPSLSLHGVVVKRPILQCIHFLITVACICTQAPLGGVDDVLI